MSHHPVTASIIALLAVCIYLACHHAVAWHVRKDSVERRWLSGWAAVSAVFLAARLVHTSTMDATVASRAFRVELCAVVVLTVIVIGIARAYAQSEAPPARTRVVVGAMLVLLGVISETNAVVTMQTRPWTDATGLVYLWVEATPLISVVALFGLFGAVEAMRIIWRADQLPRETRRIIVVGLCTYASLGLADWALAIFGSSGLPIFDLGVVVFAITFGAVTQRNDADLERRLERTVAERTVALERSNEELRDAVKNAQRAAEARRTFLANMSHEIRTPLNGILGTASLLSRTPLAHDQRRYVDTLTSAGTTLLDLVSDVLDAAQVESGKLTLHIETIGCADFVERCVGAFAATAQAKGIELAVCVESSTPDLVDADPKRLRQVLTNVIGNAIKFTTSGYVLVRVSASDDTLAIRVRDTGPGVPAAMHMRVFDPFVQLDDSSRRAHAGAGLGLAISKEIVERMAGTITIESSDEAGTTFLVTLPMRASRPSTTTMPRYVGRRALVVSDSALQREMVRLQLESFSLDVTESSFAALPTFESFDLALVDADASRTAATARDLPGHPMVCALVPVGSPIDEATPDVYAMFKPTLRSAIGECLANSLAGRRAHATDLDGASGRITSERPRARALRVLVAEDVDVNRIVLEGFLNELGIASEYATDGIEAVHMFERRGPFDAVLMDCQMPRLDGYGATVRIREIEATQSLDATPILAVTAHALPDEADRVRTAGMNGIVTKPVTREALRRALGALTESSREVPTSTRQPLRRATDGAASHDPSTFESLHRVGAADREFLSSLVDAYETSAHKYIADLADAAVHSDLGRVVTNAHALKGSSMTFGALATSAWASHLELEPRDATIAALEIRPSGARLVEEAAREARSWIERMTI